MKPLIKNFIVVNRRRNHEVILNDVVHDGVFRRLNEIRGVVARENERITAMAYDGTEVPAARSQEGIRAILNRYGIRQVQFTDCWPDGVAVEFIRVEGGPGGAAEKVIRVRIVGKPNAVNLVVKKARRRTWRDKTPAPTAERKSDAERRRVYRVIYYHLKSKLEAVAEGLVTFEEEFLPHIVLPSGVTVYDELKRQLPAVFAGTRQLALPSFAGTSENRQ